MTHAQSATNYVLSETISEERAEIEKPIERSYKNLLDLVADDKIGITIDSEVRTGNSTYKITGTTTVAEVTRPYESHLLEKEWARIRNKIKERNKK